MSLRPAIAIAALMLAATAQAGELRNPFARSAAVPPAAAGPVRGSAAPSAPAFSLRATMAAGPDSLANVDGRIVGIGDEYAGYRLIAVGEGTAVFMKNGIRFPVTVSRHDGDQG